MTNIKFVWEFFGPDSKNLSIHHLAHLKEFLAFEKIESFDSSFSVESVNFSYSYIVVHSKYLDNIKLKLKPHKAFKA
jgi:hypothetical protein